MEENPPGIKLKGYTHVKINHVRRFSITAFILLTGITAAFSQELVQDSLGIDFFLRKERVYKLSAHSNGFGIGYSRGKSITVFKRQSLNFDFVNMKTAKEVRTLYEYGENSKSYIYGKLGHLFILRGSVGQEHLLNRKPYWGGVEVRYLYHAGLSLGMLKPIYLYIINYRDKEIYPYYTNEQYDPTRHFQENIYGRSEFTYGLKQISFYPGLFGRFGLNFEFGTDNEKIKALEVGICGDFFPQGIKIMAYNDPSRYFLTAYVSFNFGTRFNRNTDQEDKE